MFGGRWTAGVAKWAVVAVGVVVLTAAGTWVALTPEGSVPDLIEMGMTISVGLGLVGAGLHLCRTLGHKRVLRVAGWTIASGVLGLLIHNWFGMIVSLTPEAATALAANGAAVTMAAGGLVGYYESGLRRREREMATARSRFRALTEGSSFGVVTIDADGTIRYANDAFEELLGNGPEALIGQAVTTILADGTENEFRRWLKHLADDNNTNDNQREFEFTAQRANGEQFPAEIGFGSYTADGRLLFTGIVRDISERRAAETKLREYTSAVTQLHEIASDINAAEDVDAIYDRTVEGALSLFDCNAARLSVREAGELIQRASTLQNGSTCTPPPVAHDVANESLRTGDVARVDDLTDTRAAASEATGPYRENGSSREAGVTDCRSMLSIPFERGGVLALYAENEAVFDSRDEEVAEMLATHVGTAIERVQARSEIRRERDRLDEFAGVLSHDIRNPLNVAMGRVTLAKEADEPDEHLVHVEHALERIERLIEDALTLAREGARVGETEQIDLRATAEEAWWNVETGEASLEVTEDRDLAADHSRLLQVFENLFRNAVEHGGQTVTVTVGATTDGFFIADDGPGIPPEERELIFESGYSTGEESTGYGLAIVKRIIDAHGWTIDVTESESGGARFEVTDVGPGSAPQD
ncbi:MAG: PAS domain S-box protein [Salinirussus sp.]